MTALTRGKPGLESDLFEQLQMAVRRFVRERLVPLERRVDEENAVPASVVAEMRDLGIAGLTIPTEYGGLGLNSFEEVQIVIELGWTSPAFRSVFGTNIGIGAKASSSTGPRSSVATICRRWPPASWSARFA